MKNTIILLMLMTIVSFNGYGQFGEIRGTVTDKLSGGPLPGATVSYESDGILKGTVTDDNGNFVLKPLVAGKYTLTFSFVTYAKVTMNDILVSAEKATYVEAGLESDNQLPPIVIEWEPPIIDKGITPTMQVLDPEWIETTSDRSVQDMVATTAGVRQDDSGGSINIRGARASSTQYVVDGIKVMGDFSLPKSAIGEITVITGGIPAMFGDATGGVVLITTKSYMSRGKR